MLMKRLSISKLTVYLVTSFFAFNGDLYIHAASMSCIEDSSSSKERADFIKYVMDAVTKKANELPEDVVCDMPFIDLLQDILTSDEFDHLLRVAPGDFFNLGIRQILTGYVASQLDVIDDTVDTILSKVCLHDSKIDIIDDIAETILSKVCLHDSKIDIVDNEVGTIFSKICTIDSKIDVIDDKVCCLVGNTITQVDVGTTGITITSPGHYTVCENIVFSPGVAASAITVDSDNVNLDLNDKTISQGNGTAGVSAVLVDSSHSGILVGNGSITGMTSSGIVLSSSSSDIQLHEIISEGNGEFGITATLIENLVIKDSVFNQNTDSGVLISASNQVCILSTIANNNGGDGFELMGTSAQYLIDGSKAFENTMIGFNLTNIVDSVLQNSIAISNGEDGISLSNSSDVEVSNNTSSKNGANGIELGGTIGTLECYVNSNKLVRNGGVNLIEDAISGLNSILGNFAQNPTLARNYCEGLSAITTVTIRQSVPFISSPTPWDNINMIP